MPTFTLEEREMKFSIEIKGFGQRVFYSNVEKDIVREAKESNRERYIDYIFHGEDSNIHSAGEDLLESNRPVVYIVVNEKEKLRVSLNKINCEIKKQPIKKVFQPHVKSCFTYCFGYNEEYAHEYSFNDVEEIDIDKITAKIIECDLPKTIENDVWMKKVILIESILYDGKEIKKERFSSRPLQNIFGPVILDLE
ncbi:MAG: hypothetical protein ACOY4F_11130 [Thermodesulfobacteriota bacterium]